MNCKTGLYCVFASLAVWLLIITVIVLKLPVKMDTVVMLSWPTLPGVLGGWVFYRMDKNGEWGTGECKVVPGDEKTGEYALNEKA